MISELKMKQLLLAAAKRLDSQPVPTKERIIRYMGEDGKIYEIKGDMSYAR